MKSATFPTLLLGLVLPAIVQASDLVEVFDLALQNDPEYAAAQADNLATRQVKPQAIAQLLPFASLRADTRWNNDRRVSGSTADLEEHDHYNSRSYSLNVTQPVFRLDTWIQLSQANSTIRRSNADLETAFQDLIIRTSEAYFNVLRAEDNVVFTKTTRRAFKQQLVQAEQRFEVGLIAITDVEEAKAGFDIAHTAVIEAENALDTSREDLRAIIGEYVVYIKTLGDTMPLITPEPNNIDEWTETALGQNRQVAAATYAAETSRKEIRRIQADGHLPTLDVVAGRDWDRNERRNRVGRLRDLENDRPNRTINNFVGLQFELPLFQGGAVLSQTREARHEYKGALDNLEQSRRQAQRNARTFFRQVVDSISRVKSLNQQTISTRKAQEAIEAGFQVGTRTSVDVLGAQRDANESVRDYKGARYDYVVATLRLKEAAGTLSPEDVALVNGWLIAQDYERLNREFGRDAPAP